MKKRKILDNIQGYLFIAPWLIGFFVFTLYPLCYSLYLSFTEYNVLTPAKWTGLDNFRKMIADEDVWISLKVTFKFAVVQVPLKLGAALLVAVLLTRKTKALNVYRVIFYLPSLLGGTVAVALTWQKIFSYHGALNSVLERFGIPAYNWLGQTNTALYVLILLGVWQFGSAMLIFMAGLNDVPTSLTEAAVIDGATPSKVFWKVKFPMITPVIFYNLVRAIINCMQAFSSAFLISNGGPLKSTQYYALYQYRQAFDYMKMGYAAALSWLLTIIILAMTAIVFKSSSSWVYYQGED